MRTFVFLTFGFACYLMTFAQSDTIWKGDTMIVIYPSEEPAPLYGGDYIMGKYNDAIEKIESEDHDNSMNLYVLSIMKANDAERMKAILPALTQNAKFMWLFINPAIRTLVGESQFKNDSAMARVYFEKTFIGCDFEYFAVMSKCKMQTEIFRDLYWYYGAEEDVWSLMQGQLITLDSLNIVTVDSIIAIKKIPTKDKISDVGMSSFLICVQHFDKETFLRYKNIMSQLNRKKQFESTDYSLYLDRWLVYKGRKQKFGTQLKHGKDGQLEFYPIRCKKRVNIRRKKVGFDETAEEYLKIVSF
jgi:hypothetical protein